MADRPLGAAPENALERPEDLFIKLERIGRGSFGEVFKALNRQTGQIVAIKVLDLDTDDDEIADVQKEIRLLSIIDSEYCIHYHGSYLNGYKLWIVMDFAGGGSLRNILQSGAIDEPLLAVIAREVLFALSYLHNNAKIIHRDIKAANILLTDAGQVKLCDFGVAGQINAASLRRHSFVGTPFWMAPEIINRNQYDFKADIWSLGITMIELATGNPPFADKDARRALYLIPRTTPAQLDASYSPAIREFVALCLREEPSERPSADELLRTAFVRAAAKGTRMLTALIQRQDAWKARQTRQDPSAALDDADGSAHGSDGDGDDDDDVRWVFDTYRPASSRPPRRVSDPSGDDDAQFATVRAAPTAPGEPQAFQAPAPRIDVSKAPFHDANPEAPQPAKTLLSPKAVPPPIATAVARTAAAVQNPLPSPLLPSSTPLQNRRPTPGAELKRKGPMLRRANASGSSLAPSGSSSGSSLPAVPTVVKGHHHSASVGASHRHAAHAPSEPPGTLQSPPPPSIEAFTAAMVRAAPLPNARAAANHPDARFASLSIAPATAMVVAPQTAGGDASPQLVQHHAENQYYLELLAGGRRNTSAWPVSVLVRQVYPTTPAALRYRAAAFHAALTGVSEAAGGPLGGVAVSAGAPQAPAPSRHVTHRKSRSLGEPAPGIPRAAAHGAAAAMSAPVETHVVADALLLGHAGDSLPPAIRDILAQVAVQPAGDSKQQLAEQLRTRLMHGVDLFQVIEKTLKTLDVVLGGVV